MGTRIKVGVVITDNRSRVLLIKEKVKKCPEPRWNIIKGTYGDIPNETIFDAAVREAKEEVGADISLTGLLGVYIEQEEDGVWVQFTFIGSIGGGKLMIASRDDQALRGEEILEIGWFSADEIKAMRHDEFVSYRAYSILRSIDLGRWDDLNIVKHL